jgi:sugar phosphate isomerase/epimerase
MAQDRRTFLATLAGAALGVSRHTVFAQSPRPERAKLRKIGIQLYTVRRQAAADLAGTLDRLGKIGFKEVELAGYYNHSAAEFRDLLKHSGLTAPSGHIAIELIDTNPAKTFDDAHTVGHEWITVPSLPRGRRETEDDWKRIGSRFNAAAAKAKAAGFRFAFHNHTDIIKPVNGIVPIDVLMRETDPSLVSFEMDIYWAVSGGADPLALLAKHPVRFRMLHVKDGKPPYTDASQTDLGQGTIDFKPIIARAKGVEHYFIESDSAADPLAFAESGHKYLANLEY